MGYAGRQFFKMTIIKHTFETACCSFIATYIIVIAYWADWFQNEQTIISKHIPVYKIFNCTCMLSLLNTCMHAFQPFISTFKQIDTIAHNNKQVAS